MVAVVSAAKRRLKIALGRSPRALEGSRFSGWQLDRLAAGGSRERPRICHGCWRFEYVCENRIKPDALGEASRWVIPGSRLLPTNRACQPTKRLPYKAAPLQGRRSEAKTMAARPFVGAPIRRHAHHATPRRFPKHLPFQADA